jgi:hypothetical protein
MSETILILLESLAMIGVLTAGFVWYALACGRRESQSSAPSRDSVWTLDHARLDPDAHLGRRGVE